MATQRVLVVGGGIAGLSVANALITSGRDVAVFEQAGELREIGAAIGVQTNAIKALRTFDLADAVIDVGVELERYEYRSWSGRLLAAWPQGEIGRRLGAPTVVVHRADLQRVLLASLPPGVVHLGARCADFVEDDTGVTLRFVDGGVERGEILVAADGINSFIRERIIGDPLRYSGWIAWRGITQLADPALPVGVAKQWVGPGRTFGAWHLPKGRIYWVGTAKMPAGGHDGPDGRKADVLAWFAGLPGPLPELIRATSEGGILRNDVFDRKPVDRWSTHRVVLVGDAAHATTPVTGQGGGQAIVDAAVLVGALASVPTLADEAAVRRAFQTYESERIPPTTSITSEAWMISRMHHWSNPLACVARDVSLRMQPEKVWIRRMEQRLGSFSG